MGCNVQRYWPNDGGWCQGVVTDYNMENGEHCIAYELGTPDESWEWFHIRNASASEFRLMAGRINVAKLLPSSAAPPPRQLGGGLGRAGGAGHQPQASVAHRPKSLQRAGHKVLTKKSRLR